MSQVDGIDVLDILDVLLNYHIYSRVVNKNIHLSLTCEKKMFLSIQDSVMISHIYCTDVLLKLQVSFDVSS